MARILLVDDNVKIRKLMEIYLKRDAFEVLQAEDGTEALSVLKKHNINLIVADIMMPEMDGYELTEQLRDAGFTMPILMVTAKETYADKKKGFEMGADDYMTKPVDMDEMLLRIKALLRRAKISSENRLVLGGVELDYEALEIRTPKQVYLLPKKEFYLLFKLLSHPKKIFTRQELMDDIWGFDSEVDERTVDVHIKRLRDKFSDLEEFEIVTVRGLGYKAERKA
ncbi:MAG: Response regulator with CheY-like receiver domain and winged-helix DNA-binding domain [Bacillota bacterium]|nr:MAG: Response regulator with CheY-like receiver domain and winged-helix DNA-binding domain [Bacillota bacterium]MBS3950517.1 response regulator transcription factor [Peptococcaceae bacterium]